MRVFCVAGISGSGKTTVVEHLIKELTGRGYRVGSVKDIHFDAFAIDTEGSNTHRHRTAGAELVVARGQRETDFLYPERLAPERILAHFSEYDFVVMEGFLGSAYPTILTGHSLSELDERFNPYVFAVSGRIGAEVGEYRGQPAFNVLRDARRLCDLVEQKVYEKLPFIPEACCAACGMSCDALARDILAGRAHRGLCVVPEPEVSLTIGGRAIDMAPFVCRLLRNAVIGVAGELDGYRAGEPITIELTPPGRR